MKNYSTYELPDGGLYFGELDANGLPHSERATCTWPNGTSYLGSWVKGKMSGVGTFYESGLVKYRGYWWSGELLHIFGTEEPPKPEAKLPKNKNKIAALLVGCNYEKGSSPLPCCINEVTEIGRKLSQIGVDVTVLKNASKEEIERGLATLAKKDANYDHALFYFSGHGAIYGGYHLLEDINFAPMPLELGVLSALSDTKFKNLIIVHDACNVIVPITQESIDEIHDHEKMFLSNHWHARNILYAFSSLNGNPSFAAKNNNLGMFALAFIENIQKRDLPILKMFDNITRFVVDYSRKMHDGLILETPNISKTLFDDDLCFYCPEE